MKPFYKIVAVSMLLLLLGASGADCLSPNVNMSAAEKACCRQMAGQCDTNAATKHPCCRKIVQRHDVANLNERSHFNPPALSLQVAALGSELLLNVSMPSFVLRERLRHPPHDPPNPSFEVLRV